MKFVDEKKTIKVTPKLKDILANASELASAKAVKKASDEDFLARVEAVCLIRRIYDGLYLDNPDLLSKMRRLYPEFARRIDSKGNKQDALPLVKSFHRFIYGTSFIKHSIGVKKWEEELAGYEEKFGLETDNESRFNPEGTTGLSIAQLKRRSSESKGMFVEYLSELTKKEFVRINDAADERMLKRQLKDLNEEIIPDFLNIRISSAMSVPTLRALDAIYALRSWLSGESHDINDPAYSNLHLKRMWQILKVLKTKYRQTKTLANKIEILSFIDTLEEDLTCKNSDFVIEEATKMAHKYGSNLTQFQRLRLQLIFAFEEIDYDNAVRELLPHANTAFELGSLTLIEHRVSPSLREAIFSRFTLLVENSIQTNDTIEISNLLTLFPFWNENPAHRQKIKELTTNLEEKFAGTTARSCSVEGQRPLMSIALPVKRLNAIAAEIYSRLDTLTGKYESRTIPA